MMTTGITASQREAERFVAFLRGTNVPTCYFRTWEKHLYTEAKAWLRDYPQDLLGDVVSEAWLLILKKGLTEFNPLLGTVETYIALKVRGASQMVRNSYTDGPREKADTGKPCRYRRRTPPQRLDVSADSSVGSIPLVDTLEDKEFAYGTIEDRALIQHVAETTASYQVGEALTRVYERGETPSAAAKTIGMTHTTLSRKLQRYADTHDANGPKSRRSPTATKGRGNGH